MDLEREKKLNSLLVEVLEVPLAERRGFLASACGDDTELFSEVWTLLQGDEELGGFLEEPAVKVPPPSPVAKSADLSYQAMTQLGGVAVTEGSGPLLARVGPYRMLEILGEGGMGRVYLAEQLEPVHRRVALKVMRSSIGGPTARARFEAERQALARLAHPNVGRILDVGTTGDGFPYFAMEVLEGVPITTYADRKRLSIDDRIRLMVAVCRGIEHAHRKQILHRDLKPSNILVEEVDGEPEPKIIDFGIAKVLDQPAADSIGTGGLVVGTPAYMSPEALEGSSDLDTRSDVYSLGVVVYELLAGIRPFEPKGQGLAALGHWVTADSAPRPSTRVSDLDQGTRGDLADLRGIGKGQLRRRLRGELDWIVLRAIAKERNTRYGSAAELAEDLERFLARQPVAAYADRPWYRARKFVERHHRALVVATTVLFLLLLGTGYHLSSRQRSAELSEQMTREVERIDWIQRVAYQLPKRDRSPELSRIRRGMERIEATMGEMGRVGRGPGSYALGRGFLALRDLDAARRHLEAAWAAGYRRPEAALALGLTLTGLHDLRLEVARRLPDPVTRGEVIRRANEELSGPALEFLSRGRAAQGENAELLQAHIALHQEDLGAAVQHSREALARSPWLYEAHFLEARALRERADGARREGERELLLDLLTQAESAVRAGLEVGRSDPTGFLLLCSITQERLSYVVRFVQPGVDELHAQATEACASAREVAPNLKEADLHEAFAWLNLADVQIWDRNEDPAEALDRAAELLERYLEARPESGDGYRLLGMVHSYDALYQERNSVDPTESLGRGVGFMERALELEPGFTFIHLELCNAFSRRANYRFRRGGDPLGDLGRAVENCQQAIEAQPDTEAAQYAYGAALVRRSEYNFERGIDPTPDLDLAAAAVARAKDLDPNPSPGASILASVELLRGHWLMDTGGNPTAALRRSIEASAEALDYIPGDGFPRFMACQAHLDLALYAITQGRSPEADADSAREECAAGFARLPDLPSPYADLAGLLLAQARVALLEGRSPEPEVVEALGLTRRSLELDDRRADTITAHGEVLLVRAAGQLAGGRDPRPALAEAKEHIDAALAQDPGSPLPHLAFARYAWRSLGASMALGSPVDDALLAEGLRHVDEARRINPAKAEALALRGALLALRPGAAQEARGWVEKALEENPNLAWEWRGWLEARGPA
ncbi:MAG: protein kinase [Acidobacteriota bacterium]